MTLYLTGRNAAVDAVADLIDSASLHTADPGAAGTTAEVSATGTNYARAAVAGTMWAETNGRSGANANVVFPNPSAAWGTVTHVVLWGSSSPIMSIQLTTARVITATTTPVQFAMADLGITASATTT